MKKAAFFLLIFSLIAGPAFGQEQSPCVYVKAGVSFPLFDLANGNLADSTAGIAATGLHVEVGYNFPVSDHFGLGLAADYYGNQLSNSKVSKYYKQIQTGSAYGIQTSYAWSAGGLFVRPSYNVLFSKNFSWQIYASGGFLAYFTPEFILTTSDAENNTQKIYTQLRSKGFSFAYGLGSRFNFKIHKTHLFVDADFLASKISYKATGTDSSNNSYSYRVHQMLGYISVNMGYTIFL